MAENKEKVTEIEEVKETKDVKEPEKVNKFGKQDSHTADGVKYTFQFPGTRKVQEIIDDSKVNGILKEGLYNEQLMEHVIVKPNNLTFEYWDEHNGYREVMAAADRFLGNLL